MNPIETLETFLAASAREVGWELKPYEAKLVESANAVRVSTEPVVAGEAPRLAGYGLYTVILASLGSDFERARQAWIAGQRFAAAVRTKISADGGEDLVLIFVGPPGSKDGDEWKTLAMEVERNDLVCRKLVWLPPKQQSEMEAALEHFKGRTFLATPWQAPATAEPTALDALWIAHASLREWQNILDAQPVDKSAIDYDDLVAKLIQAHKS